MARGARTGGRDVWRAAPRWLAFLGVVGLPFGCTGSPDVARERTTERAPAEVVTPPRAWFEKQRLTVEGTTNFGFALAVSGTTAVVANRATGIYAYTLANNTWGSRYEFPVDGAEPGWEYGPPVAVSGDSVIIGTPGSRERAAAHVFTRTGSGWSLEARLVADAAAEDESFGTAVGIEGDLAVVGAPYGESVYVFTRSGDEWTLQKRLSPVVEAPNSYFGAAVAVSGDLVAVGAPRWGDATPYLAGQAYAYTKPSDPSGTWPEDVFVGSTRQDFDFFGVSVDVEGDTVLVGSQPFGAGVAYAFTKEGSGWSRQELLSDRSFPEGDAFGQSVAISGARAAVGAPARTPEPRMHLGAAYVLVRDGTAWNQEDLLIGPASQLAFGHSLAISGDWLFAGAPYEPPGGAVYVHRRLLDVGNECQEGAECGSGHCVSGVCCEGACTRACEECSTGLCSISEAGSRGAPSCSPYWCDGSSRDCPADCVTNGDCIATYHCRENRCVARGRVGDACRGAEECLSGHCLGRRCSGTSPNGAPCEDASECERGNCVDGVCCDDACRGQCEACDVEGDEGRCVPTEGSPHGDRAPCAGTGPCEGTCDGSLADACIYPTRSEECGRLCEDGEEIVSTCNGQGECVASEPRACLEFVCDADGLACLTSCRDDDDCAEDLSCWSDGACEPSLSCTDDRLRSEAAPGGEFEDCAPYFCNDVTGACGTSCTSSSDCVEPNACDSNQRCVPPETADTGGCGCRAAPGTSGRFWSSAAWLLVFAFAVRRSRRRAVVRSCPP